MTFMLFPFHNTSIGKNEDDGENTVNGLIGASDSLHGCCGL